MNFAGLYTQGRNAAIGSFDALRASKFYKTVQGGMPIGIASEVASGVRNAAVGNRGFKSFGMYGYAATGAAIGAAGNAGYAAYSGRDPYSAAMKGAGYGALAGAGYNLGRGLAAEPALRALGSRGRAAVTNKYSAYKGMFQNEIMRARIANARDWAGYAPGAD